MACSFPAKEESDDESNTRRPNWVDLPIDITSNILKRLNTIDLASACLVCPLWCNICKDSLMWRTIHINYCVHYSPIELREICRYAIKRSCGHLEEIDIDFIGTDDLLQLIAHNNGSNLRCMRLSKCHEISDKGFSEAVMKFPHLEKLYISISKLSEYSFLALGRSCPLLKSLTFTGNRLTNDGLIAILDGCPLIESLDISGCINAILTYSLKKRCCEQIKDLQLPDRNVYYDEGENDNDYDDYDYDDDYFDYMDTYLDKDGILRFV